MKKDIILKVIGSFIGAFWVIYSALQLWYVHPASLLWFCNISLFLIALACFERSSKLLYYYISLAIVFETSWTIDWIIKGIFSYSFFNIPGLYLGVPFFLVVMSFINHIITLPLSIYILLYINPITPSFRSHLLFMFLIAALLSISYALPPTTEINCVHHPCIKSLSYLRGPVYTLGWFSFIFILGISIQYFLLYPFHLKISKKRL